MGEFQSREIPDTIERNTENLEHRLSINELERHLKTNWTKQICDCCGDNFYSKPYTDELGCGSFSCEDGYSFLESKPPRKIFSEPTELSNKFKSTFKSRNYTGRGSLPLTGHLGPQVFVGTAGQIFDEQIFNEAPCDNSRFYSLQPVIRMQKSIHDGFLKSFVNMSIEQIGASIDEHIESLEDYLDYLSLVGLFVGDIRIKLFEDTPNWGKGKFSSAVMALYYGGLELGVLNYFTGVPQSTRDNLIISDVSFGLERISWSLNKTPRFIDVIGPPSELLLNSSHESLDSYRTATLMIKSGVMPNRSTEQGDKLRSLFNQGIPLNQPIRYDLLRYYNDWWDNYMETDIGLDTVEATWQLMDAQRIGTELKLGNIAINRDELVLNNIKNGSVTARDFRNRL